MKPGWMPNVIYNNFPWSGERVIFFRPIFNIADASISIGVIALILFQRSFFREEKEDVVSEGTAAAYTPDDGPDPGSGDEDPDNDSEE